MIATNMVHWPGEDVPACDEHRAKLIGVGKAMGSPVTYTLSPPTFSQLKCTNCEKEDAQMKHRTDWDTPTRDGGHMIRIVRNSLKARLEGRDDGGDIEIMRLVDEIVKKEGSETKQTRTCNRHHDCDLAEQEAKERWIRVNGNQLVVGTRLYPGIHPDFHCHNDECEECFGN